MHEAAMISIENHVRGSLKNSVIRNGWPEYDSFATHVNRLSTEVRKHKSNWLTVSDVFSIFYELVYGAIQSLKDNSRTMSGNLWDLLGEASAEELVFQFVRYFESIPRDYYVYFPLPAISDHLPSGIRIGNLIELRSFKKACDIPGFYPVGLMQRDKEFEIGKVFFCKRVSGYAGNRLENICIRSALSSFKIILQQGIYKQLFSRTAAEQAGLGIFGLMSHHQIQKSAAVSVDLTSNFHREAEAQLPLDLCRFLENVDIKWDHAPVQAATSAGDIGLYVSAELNHASQLIEDLSPDAERVRSAINWCFDSYVSENKVLAFLQVCIGLEALLGDDSLRDSPLTETLADRCAYLTGPSISARKKIRDKFRELYRTRSKLVHGNLQSLNEDEIGLFDWGRVMLEFAVQQEMRLLRSKIEL